ncbi:MAG: GNAT family N-acetyltransferase [Candidatus Eisenbacteria bacterium]|uniref:GNAT family N-acetyltransferase n=1 Tax=Eiseniibacteriota bacterium TaxID=2212470 RepID=A0A956NB77_UNCEI|nr:GNAT family N-acetyltransferase [Candidatus Eisenbacteria bacterium]
MEVVPVLETERLQLRPIGQGDLEFVFRHFGDPAICRYLKDAPPVETTEEAQGIIDAFAPGSAKPQCRWILVQRSDGRPIGTCGYHHWVKAYNRAEIGYDLTESAWGKGLMREALVSVIEFGFGTMGLNRIEAFVHPENTASLGILERLHFQKEGVVRDLFYMDGVYYDHDLLSLLERDWRAGES